MSEVTINEKYNDVAYDAIQGDLSFNFVYKGEAGTIEGTFFKLNNKGNQTEQLGGYRISPDGSPTIDLRKSSSEFLSDFQKCLDLVVIAINHVKKAKK